MLMLMMTTSQLAAQKPVLRQEQQRKKEIGKKSTRKFLSMSELVTLASYKTAWILARKRELFSDGELVKEIICSVMEILLENCEAKTKRDTMQKVNNLQLSHQTIACRIQVLAQNIKGQLLEHLKNCMSFSVALDKSCGIRDHAQVLFWVRLVSKDLEIHEEMLAICALKDQTHSVDFFETFKTVAEELELDMTMLVSVTTDGAPAMVGQKSGFVSLLKQQPQVSILTSFQCILHQENLCVQMTGTDTLKSVMETVIKIVSYIRGNSMNHCQFVELKEMENYDFNDIVFFANVCC